MGVEYYRDEERKLVSKPIEKHYREPKNALRKHKQLDPYFLSKYTFSPYHACQHGCLYCDGRAEKYYVDGEFDQDIVIRRNLPELLKRELPKLREKGIITIGSGVSDPYQPVEADERIMAECAAVLGQYPFAVALMTKSSLILRDLDTWGKVNTGSRFLLMVSLTTVDDAIRSIFEPAAGPVSARLDMLRAFKKMGSYVGVLAMPFLPFISDSNTSLAELIAVLAEIPVDFVLPGALTLRPGKQKNLYLQTIRSHYPQLSASYKNLYAEERQSGSPLLSYRKQLYRRVYAALDSYGIPSRIPHHVYRDLIPTYDEIHVLLSHMVELYQTRGVAVRRLEASLERYAAWLLEEKTYFNRRSSLPSTHIEDRLAHMMHTDEFDRLLGNDKLSTFLRDIIVQRKTFDYVNLKI